MSTASFGADVFSPYSLIRAQAYQFSASLLLFHIHGALSIATELNDSTPCEKNIFSLKWSGVTS
jgi:hypothetical protein